MTLLLDLCYHLSIIQNVSCSKQSQHKLLSHLCTINFAINRILDLSYFCHLCCPLNTHDYNRIHVSSIFQNRNAPYFLLLYYLHIFVFLMMHRCLLDGTEHQNFCLVQNNMVLQLMFGPLAAYSPNFYFADHFFRLNNLTQLIMSNIKTLSNRHLFGC